MWVIWRKKIIIKVWHAFQFNLPHSIVCRTAFHCNFSWKSFRVYLCLFRTSWHFFKALIAGFRFGLLLCLSNIWTVFFFPVWPVCSAKLLPATMFYNRAAVLAKEHRSAAVSWRVETGLPIASFTYGFTKSTLWSEWPTFPFLKSKYKHSSFFVV